MMPKRKALTALADEATAVASPRKVMKSTNIDKSAKAYNTTQANAIAELRGIINQDRNVAAKLLKQNNWSVNHAVVAYFNNSSGGGNHANRNNLNKVFDKFRDDPKEEPDEINAQGTGTLLGELQVDLEDIAALIFSEIVDSPSLGKLTREGFVNGWSALGVDNLAKMKTVLEQQRSALLSDMALFKRVYNHTFQLALSPGSKTLQIDMAVEFWRLLFSPSGYYWCTPNTPWLDWWLEFQEANRTKAVNKDLWKQTFQFAQETLKDETLSFWSDQSSWPSVIDEFVGWVKKEKRAGAGVDEMAVD